MDEIELLVAETFRHLDEKEAQALPPLPQQVQEETQDILPDGPGLIYHIQKATSIVVIRSLVSKNIRQDYGRILEDPEEFPSLRLLEGGTTELDGKIRFF